MAVWHVKTGFISTASKHTTVEEALVGNSSSRYGDCMPRGTSNKKSKHVGNTESLVNPGRDWFRK